MTRSSERGNEMQPDDGIAPCVLRGRKYDRYDRHSVDLEAVVTRLMGAPSTRVGDRGDRLWWPCPFHDDKNPSFTMDDTGRMWKCYGCGKWGDAAELVMQVYGIGFVEAKNWINGHQGGIAKDIKKAPSQRRARTAGMSEVNALFIAEGSAKYIWWPDKINVPILDYLHRRGLTDDTIRANRLGVTGRIGIAFGVWGNPHGITIPWFEDNRLTLLKLRQFDEGVSKYRELYRSSPTIYPSPALIVPDRPLVVCEGEFDALLLGQELAGLAAVITLGSAASRPNNDILAKTRIASRLFLGHHADDAGDLSAKSWPDGERVRPPAGKDWTVAKSRGLKLRQVWARVMGT